MPEVDVCPECDETHIRVVASDTIQTDDADASKRYHCWKCGARFDEPAVREAHHCTKPKSGLAKRLYEADSLADLADHGGGPA
jgi:transcriptional regulator NrdR family protein